ncbi:hypothetical protein [Salinigranum halophilum]|uniref:hypothetical protein n=1 Tax=Salinigranum halophilum TaxID=2565931 RepID=UPI0010A810FC|nr:hypothetical protein [Salinigranum halophilum]
MYPEAFRFEIVPFSVGDVFDPPEALPAGTNQLAAFEGIDELGQLDGFEVFEETAPSSDPAVVEQAQMTPTMARWSGVETKNNDWMTLLSRFSEVTLDSEDAYRSPLSVLLEQALGTDEPFVYQVVFSPKHDWTKEAEHHKRNLKMGTTGMWSAFKQEFAATLLGTSEEERRQRHRPDTPEQIGGTISGPDASGQSTQHSRMGQIDLKQPAVTFEVSLRVAGDAAVINGITGAFTALSGPYYGIEGAALGPSDREYQCLTEATLGRTGFRNRFSDATPVIVASPDELANFVTVPSTGALPKPSRGASGGAPDVRSPLTATDEELLGQFDTGMCIGEAETASLSRQNIPIRLTAGQLVHHVIRAATTGSGKTTAMINDGLTAYDELDGPVFIFDKKGGSMCAEYKRAHFRRFGDLDDIVHLPVPGPNGELPAFPFFDIRPQLAAGLSRESAVQEKVDRYNELLTYVLGEEQHNQAFVAQEILSNLIVALFDPVHGKDAFAISELLEKAIEMQEALGEMQNPHVEIQADKYLPAVTDSDLRKALRRHLKADPRRFATSIDAVMNRITKLRERDFIWRMLNFVPEWDDDIQTYAEDQMLFDLDDLLDSKKVVLIDTGEFRPASSNLFTVLLLDYLWSWVRLRKRRSRAVPTPADGYCVNLIIDEAAPILQASLVRDEMIPDAREFGLAFELIVHFPEQVKRDALDTRAYKEILRNVNTKLIGKLAIDDELAVTLFHEELDSEALSNRIASLPRGEWLAQLPDTGFMTDTPELVTLKPLPIPTGHSDGERPVDAGTYSPTADQTYREANESQWTRTRFTYCLLPGVNCPPDAAQRAARWGAGVTNSDADQAGTTPDAEGDVPNGSDSDTAEPAETEGDSARGSRDRTNESTPRRESSSGDTNNDEGPSGGASNEFGTVLGTGPANTGGRTNRAKKTHHSESRPSDAPRDENGTEARGSVETSESEETANDETEDELTDDERRFLKNVIKALNGELDGYELTDSMTTIRNRSGSTVDEDSLVERGYIENPYVGTRKYYYVTEKGQQAVDRKLYAGRDLGDLHEKVHHKVFTECFARYLKVVEGQSIEKYYEPMGGGMVFDVAGFVEFPGGQRNLTAIGEVITQVKPERVVKHYDDFAQYDRVSKHWIVKDITVAHDLVRALHRAGRIETVPSKAVQKHTRIAEIAFDGNDEWQIHGGSEIIETVRGFASETRESGLD